jgi:predicted nuclease of predicted toxin-antitoxin system
VKLLFDQNLSPELAKLLADLFPESEHVANIGMGHAADDEIAAHAKRAGFVVVTKDSDFLAHARAPLQCKVVWVRLPNCSTAKVGDLLRRFAIRIRHFGDDPHSTLLMLR